MNINNSWVNLDSIENWNSVDKEPVKKEGKKSAGLNKKFIKERIEAHFADDTEEASKLYDTITNPKYRPKKTVSVLTRILPVTEPMWWSEPQTGPKFWIFIFIHVR